MKGHKDESSRERWARFRFSVIGPLLAAPPPTGQLRAELQQLARKAYRHPETGAPTCFGLSTIERWYYAAREARDPVTELKNRRRKDAGEHPSLGLLVRQAFRAQYREHKSWSYRLHCDNVRALAEAQPELGRVPSYEVVRRWMKSQGLYRQRRRRHRHTAGALLAEKRLECLEVRSYEAEYVGGLWHSDFHSGSLPIVTRKGEWLIPQLHGVLDDCSRLGCHAQWYLAETSENYFHGMSQAFQKWGLPRALMNDNGGAETAAEIEQGLTELGIIQELTLPYSPYQNAKQEVFWALIEGRLLPMLEGVKDLTLQQLNEATLAFVTMEYNRAVHSEIGTSPLKRFLEHKNVLRDSPGSDELRRCFQMKASRKQRRSDGTLTVEGIRYEIPSRFRHLERLSVRYARWDMSSIDLVDEHTGVPLATLYPLNKTRNAEGERRRLEPVDNGGPPPASGTAPLLRKLLAEYSALGLPPAYLPKEENDE
ncbi:MAG: transposase family protein [bacterium]|nr:transposase family protein [bacterium]